MRGGGERRRALSIQEVGVERAPGAVRGEHDIEHVRNPGINTSITDSSTVPDVMSVPLWTWDAPANAAEFLPVQQIGIQRAPEPVGRGHDAEDLGVSGQRGRDPRFDQGALMSSPLWT